MPEVSASPNQLLLSPRRLAGLLLLLLAVMQPVAAQTPGLNVSGLPATPLIGEQTCSTIEFVNLDAAEGFGPYIFATVPPGVSVTSNTFLGIPPPIEQVGTIDASGMITDPISGQSVPGDPGGNATIVRYPVGSVLQGQPPLVLDVCAVLQPGVEIGVPLNVSFLPGFEFGDTPTGDNGPITGGAATSSTITPQLARVRKNNTAPEDERPPGPSHIYRYNYAVDVSNGVTILNVMLSDALPAELQWTGGPITVNAQQGALCQVTQNPNTAPTSGGTLEAQCAALTGTSSNSDLVVSLPVYITDILDQSTPATDTINNTVNLDYNYQMTPYNNSADDTVVAKHVAVQKSVNPGTVVPGDTLTYTVNFQVTDYSDTGGESLTSLVIEDVLDDGLGFLDMSQLTLNGMAVPVTPVTVAGPGPGQTTVSWDIAQAAGGQVPLGSDGQLSYQAEVLQTNSNGDPLVASDNLGNSVQSLYTHSEGASGSDGSSADVNIAANQPDKTIVSPSPLPATLKPGDVITFRLSMGIPSNDTLAIQMTDFLPLPVTFVDDIDPNTDITVPNLPGITDVEPIYSSNSSANSFTLTWPDPAGLEHSLVAADITVTITNQPFADGLFLTNLLQTSTVNNNGDIDTDLLARSFRVGAPDMSLTKGVFTIANPNAVLAPAPPVSPDQGLVDSDASGADANDQVVYFITAENQGGAPAHNITLTDPAVPGLVCNPVAANDVTNGLGQPLAFSGTIETGLVVPGPVAANDNAPAGGGAPFSDDTVLVRRVCLIDTTAILGSTLTNTASLTYTSTAAATDFFPEQTDDASVTLATPTISKSIIDVTPGYAGNLQRVYIGEMVTYEVVVNLPEGTQPDVNFNDLLDSGLAFVEGITIAASNNVSTSVPGGFAQIAANNVAYAASGGGDANLDRQLNIGPGGQDFGFGTIRNTNPNNAVAETITIQYRARVLNVAGNVRGATRNNRARWSWEQGGSRTQIQANAPNVRIVEPGIDVTKVFTPDSADQGSPASVQIRVRHNGSSDGTAFELAMIDVLPLGITPDLATVTTVNCNVQPDIFSAAITQINVAWEEFPLGSDCTIAFDTTGQPPIPAGTTILNCAEARWSSLDDSDLPLPQPPSNPLAVQRLGDTTAPGGAANTYYDEGCDELKIFGVGIDKTVIASSQAHTMADATAEELTIGEEITFLITATLPEDPVTNLVIEDSLPAGAMLLEALSATVRPLPANTNLTVPGFPPVPVLSDMQLSDGINDTVTVTFGSPIANNSDGVSDARDRIEVEVTARVRNLPVNQNLAEDDNIAQVRFGNSLEDVDQVPLRVVEPLLSVTKTGDVTSVEAGNNVTYTLRVEHASGSRADAFDVMVDDTLPAELTLVPGSLALGANCPTPPDSGPTALGNDVSAGWSAFPRGSLCEIEFQATVSVNAVAGSVIENTTNLFWMSLDDTAPSNVDERAYQDQGSWQVRVGDPGLTKTLTDSDIAETNDPQLTIGETATFEVVAEFPDGTTQAVRIADILPFQNGAMEIVSSQITSIGSDLTVSGVSVGDPGDDCAPNCDPANNGFDTTVLWLIGDVVNAPDTGGPVTGPPEQITFEVVGIVRDDAINQGIPVGPDFLFNTAGLDSANLTSGDQAPVTLVEPRLALEHSIAPGQQIKLVDAGDVLDIQLDISHLAESSATAFNVEVVDTLDASVLWVGDNTVISDCPGLVVDSSALPAVRFTFDQLPLASLACSIGFQVQMSPTLVIPGLYLDQSTLAWESAPGSIHSRVGADSGQVVYVALVDGSLTKRLESTSVPLTQRNLGLDPLLEDITIGEVLTYELLVGLPEGSSDPVTVTDVLPAGLALEGARVTAIGANISTSLPGTPVINGNTVEFDFGAVTNVADSVINEDDVIVLTIIARLLDDNGNQSGGQLSNDASVQIGNFSTDSQATIDIVAPLLSLDKAFGAIDKGRVPITLTLTNTGSAPAYSAVVTDVFDETEWVAGSLVVDQVPTGWSVTASSAGGQTTITFQPTGNPPQPLPSQVILPGGSRTAVFSLELVQPVTVPSIDNIANATADSLPASDPAAREVTAQGSDSLALPNLDATKAWSGANNPAVPGDTLTYTLEITNTNGTADATDVTVTDQPDLLGEFQAGSVVAPDGTILTGNVPGDTTIAVNFPVIAAGQTVSITYQVLVPTPYPAGVADEFVNQATITSVEVPDFFSDDPATGAVDDPTIAPIIADPVMQILKDDVSDVIGAGGTIFYQLDYANIGNQDATGVVISDSVPPNTSFNAGSSTPGWSCADMSPPGTVCEFTVGDLGAGMGDTIYFAVTVVDPVPQGVDQIDNTAFITDDGSNSGGVPSTDDDSDSTIVLAAPILDITKDDGGITTVPGGTVVYTLDYANNGTQDATGVRLIDIVPPNTVFNAAASLPDVWSCPDGSPPLTVCELDVGDLQGEGLGTGQANFAVRVNDTLPAGVEQVFNLVLIADDGNATLGLPVIALDFDTTPIIAQPDLVIDKDDGGIIGRPGTIIPYTLSWQQVGNQDATGVVITETVPVGASFSAVGSQPDVWSCADGSPPGTVCTLALGDQPVGASGVSRFGLLVDDPLPPGLSEVVNTATIADDGSNGPDPTPANNTDTVATLVTLFPPAGAKSARRAGTGTVVWRMYWFNYLNTTDLPVSVYDPIPAGSTFVPGSLSCTATGASQCLSATYNAAENRIEVLAIIAPDFGAPVNASEDQLANEIAIVFESEVDGTTTLHNVGNACWDENNSGTAEDDRAMGQRCINVRAAYRVAFSIPVLGPAGLAVLMLSLLMVARRRLGARPA